MEEFNPELGENGESGIDFSPVSNWEELFVAIDKSGGVQGSRKFYTPEELKSDIDMVRKGDYHLGFITRTGNLRNKVEELLKNESKSEQ